MTFNQLFVLCFASTMAMANLLQAQTTQAVVQRGEISPEDAKARELLDKRLPELRFDGIAFSDVIEFLRDVTSANIFVDWKTLEAAGINRTAPVTARMQDVQFKKAIEVILQNVGGGIVKLGYTVDEGVITISTIEEINRSSVSVRVYDIRDLVTFQTRATRPTTQPGDDEQAREDAAEQISTFLVNTIDPESWRDNGGTIGTVRYLSGQLVVTQTADGHRQIAALLAQFRERFGAQISVTTRFVELTPDQLPQGVGDALAQKPKGDATLAAFLNERQVSEILRTAQGQEATILTAPRVTLFSGDSTWVKVMTQQAYLSGYVVVKAEGQPTRYEPQSSTVEHGLILEVAATTDQEMKNVTLHLKPTVTELDGFESIPWPGAPDAKDLMIQKPKLDVREIKLFLSIPDGQTALFSGWKSGDGGEKVVYILAKPTIVDPKPIKAAEAAAKH